MMGLRTVRSLGMSNVRPDPDGFTMVGRNINDILYGLGIVPKDTVADDYSEVKGHQTHFHIYLNPPTWVPIDTTKHLLSNDAKETSADLSITPITLQTESKGLLAYAQTITNTGEEFMFTMDIPYVPVKDAPIVLAQAAVSGTGVGAKQPDYLLKECKEIPTLAPQISAERGIDPAGWLTVELENRSNRYIDEAITTTVKITLLESPIHGKLISLTSVSGRVYYRYDINDAEQGYEGKDKAVFMAEFEGKAYNVVVNLLIGAVAALPNESTCPAPTLIKLKTKPASGSTGYNLNSLSVTFANLDGGALKQRGHETTGSGLTTYIKIG